jgi:hypothetical protein
MYPGRQIDQIVTARTKLWLSQEMLNLESQISCPSSEPPSGKDRVGDVSGGRRRCETDVARLWR